MQSNSRFAVMWALLLPVLTGAMFLVEPLGIAHWTDTQTALSVAEINAFSALVLVLVAYAWATTPREPAALSGGVGAFAIATFATGNGFHWWMLSDRTENLLLAFIGALVLLVLGFITRANVTPTPPV